MSDNSTEQVQQQDEDIDENEIVTMVDVLQEEQELEEDTNAVLGGSDEKICSYNQGYVKRQALYACMTCIPQSSELDDSKLAGICLACSYRCHEGHSLIELYTKRNFRCDCGNKKFINNKCSFVTLKDDLNENNIYNQNFMGLYCVCKRPYPDPEDSVNDEMIQCSLCEDWYHFRHLTTTEKTPPDNFSELICQICTNKYDFIKHYSHLIYGFNSCKTNETADVDVVETTKDTEQQCKKPEQRIDDNFAAFMLADWRQQLCKCTVCINHYNSLKLNFITDTEDMVQFYEEKGKLSKRTSQYEAGMQALSNLDRVKQVEAIAEYNDMKNQLKDYLQKFATNKKIVREEDIKEFFSIMSARKRQRVEVPNYCR